MKYGKIVGISLAGVFGITVLCFFLHYRNVASTRADAETNTEVTQQRQEENDSKESHQQSSLDGTSGESSSDSGIKFAPTKEDPVQNLDDRIESSKEQPTKDELTVGYGEGETSLKDIIDGKINFLEYKTVVFKNCRVINLWKDVFYGRTLANLRVNNCLKAGDEVMSDRRYNTVEFAFADGSDIGDRIKMNTYIDIKCSTEKYAYVDTKEGDGILVLFGEVTSQK